MFDIDSAASSVKLALLEARLLERKIDRETFARAARRLGYPNDLAQTSADKLQAIAKNQARLQRHLRPTYDYVVIGSGAAGAVVAARLAEKKGADVLLLEAGGSDLQPGVLIPETWFLNQTGPLDWSLSAEAAPGVNQRAIVQAAGRVLGGSTSINGMVWARGHRDDFEDWARLSGDLRWGYAHALETYRRIEDWHGEPDPARRGSAGPVYVQPAPAPHPLAQAFLDGAREQGFPVFADQNGALQESDGGAAISNVRIRDGRRLNMAGAYLYPVMDQANLTVLTGAPVTRVLIEDGMAQGVEFEWRGTTHQVQATAEVIVSAGALATPKILMLSGVGDSEALKRHGLHCHAHLPGVGENLMDHPIIGAGLWEAPMEVRPRNNAAEANLFAKSQAGLSTPDLHIFMIELPYLSEVTRQQARPNSWSLCPGLARPFSRGRVRLRSADPREPMTIEANMLDDPRDLVALREGLRIARAIGNSKAMAPYVAREILPGPLGGEALDQLIRDGAMSMHHPVGTARMGQDEMAVVDAQLRVRGVSRLRVADGSIMPTITTGNTQAPCVLIGERMAEILRGG